jgi:hypothetical protein
MKVNDMTTSEKPWGWFTEKVLPSLFLSVALSVTAASFAIWQSVANLTNNVKHNEERLGKIEMKMENLVTRTELLETLKRVEQQMQIVLLQSGVNQKFEIH